IGARGRRLSGRGSRLAGRFRRRRRSRVRLLGLALRSGRRGRVHGFGFLGLRGGGGRLAVLRRVGNAFAGGGQAGPAGESPSVFSAGGRMELSSPAAGAEGGCPSFPVSLGAAAGSTALGVVLA